MSLKQFFIALFACVTLSQVGLRCARAEPSYEVSLEDEFGNSLQKFHHQGQVFAMGRMGQRYNLRVSNRTARRVEAVVSVDGRDVLSGQPGDYKGQRGYLVPAWGSVLIEGFRTSMSDVAAFRFTTPGDSYSSRMGSPENVGVIGAAFFPEAAPPPPPPVYRMPRRPYSMDYKQESGRGRSANGGLGSRGPAAAEATQAAPSPKSGAADSYRDEDSASNIGTQYGEQTNSEVVEVSFQRARPRHPDQLLVVRYDDRAGLEARGIRTSPHWQRPEPRVERGPSAFPVNRFAPPPPPYGYYN